LSTGTAWSITGNAATVPGTNFVGTIDAKDLRIKTAATDRVAVLSGGNTGINTTAPTQKLEVKNGNVKIATSANATGGRFRWAEKSSGGTNYTAFRSTTMTLKQPLFLPDTQGAIRTSMTNDGAGNLFWANPAQSVQFNTSSP